MIIIIITVFIIGYLFIAFEQYVKINKAASALITGVVCWAVFIFFSNAKNADLEKLTWHLGDISAILFFLLGAMTIVKLIDGYSGFEIITEMITERNKIKLLWIIGLITFFLSAVLDNLTTTIVIISLLRKIIKNDRDRMFFSGTVVIAANAGGSWSPIGDVTTTMLWIGGQITAVNIIIKLLMPSLLCLIAVLFLVSLKLKGSLGKDNSRKLYSDEKVSGFNKKLILYSGMLVLILIPVFKTITNLPPYMGMLFGLGFLWILTEFLNCGKKECSDSQYSVTSALKNIDSSSILFFLGILLCVAALQSAGILNDLSSWISTKISSENIILTAMGLLSSIIDNVPLVAALQKMYGLSQYGADHYFWELLAYCTGTGGSLLIIGSAAGIAAMGIEKIRFFWYFKNLSLIALAGYFTGIFFYIFQNWLVNLISG